MNLLHGVLFNSPEAYQDPETQRLKDGGSADISWWHHSQPVLTE